MALVLAGGNALGAFEAGAYQALHEHDLWLDWIVGTSIGAVNGALIAGNRPERRVDALHTFWSKVAWPTGGGNAPDGLIHAMQRLARQMRTASFGNQAEVRAALVEADRPNMRLVTIGGDPGPEVGRWFYDYAEQAIMRRWDAGASKVRDALTALQGAPALAHSLVPP